jgi:hypothetical protein
VTSKCYLDDVIIYGDTRDEFCKNLETVFQLFQAMNIQLKLKKSNFGIPVVTYAQHMINAQGSKMSDGR